MQSAALGRASDNSPLRVLFLTPYFRPYLGGIERAIERLSFQLLDSPEVAAVGVLTTKYAFPRIPHPEWADREQTPEGIRIFRLTGFPRSSLPIYSAPLVWFPPGQVRRYLDEFNPHVIHFVGDGWFWGHFWSWFWRKGRARFVFTPSYHTLPARRGWLRPINRFLCRSVDHVVTLTRQEAGQVQRDYRANPDKLVVIGWGASPLKPEEPAGPGSPALPDSPDPMKPPAALETRDTEDTPLTILCVGRLSRHKGQKWLLDTYRQARPRLQRPVRLVLVGRDEDAEADLRAAVRAAGLEGEVSFTGELDDAALAQWYGRADLFALFSQYEAFGLVYFEAMLGGMPVLTHAVGANRELLTRGAVVVPRFDREAAVTALVQLVNDDAHRRRLGAAGREYALGEFTWSAVAEKYLAVYRGEPGGNG